MCFLVLRIWVGQRREGSAPPLQTHDVGTTSDLSPVLTSDDGQKNGRI